MQGELQYPKTKKKNIEY